MSSNTKAVIGISAFVLVLSLTAAGLVSAVFGGGAMLRVQVHEKCRGGDDVAIAVPSALVHLALPFLPHDALQDAGDGLGCWSPVIQAACSELSKSPDFEMVRVESAEEVVRIWKKNGAVHIYVDNPEERVEVSVPLRTFRSVFKRLSSAGAV